MTILDSNTIIYLSNGLVKADEVFEKDDKYAISIITYMEVLGYEFKSKLEEKFINDMFRYFEIIYIDKLIANETINLRKQHKIKLPDAIICASCIAKKATLITADVKLKKIKKLKVNILDLS